MQCLFEEINQFYLSLEIYQDTKIAKYFAVFKCYCIIKFVHLHKVMDWNLFFNCFYIKLLIIIFISMFDKQCSTESAITFAIFEKKASLHGCATTE